jgi:hypothetical protein
MTAGSLLHDVVRQRQAPFACSTTARDGGLPPPWRTAAGSLRSLHNACSGKLLLAPPDPTASLLALVSLLQIRQRGGAALERWCEGGDGSALRRHVGAMLEQ